MAPLYLHVHAFIFGGWMLLLSAQTLLVQKGRLDLHRKLGLLSVVLVPLVAGSGLALAAGSGAACAPTLATAGQNSGSRCFSGRI